MDLFGITREVREQRVQCRYFSESAHEQGSAAKNEVASAVRESVSVPVGAGGPAAGLINKVTKPVAAQVRCG